ncbi:MAG: guanine deaminase [Deltaproteobacteria bacterium]|nr:guanine deaminase [Deltaproteobacteria bacterium]
MSGVRGEVQSDVQGIVSSRALRGSMLSFSGDPFAHDLAEVMHYEEDALIWIEAGRIRDVGPAARLAAQLPPDLEVVEYRDSLILPGFVDCHVHYPQTRMIGAFGERLVDWLEKYAFPAEQSFGDAAHGREAARVFLAECLRAGTTTAAVYCTVHPESVEAFFEESHRLDMRNIAGKLLMDRNAPEPLLDTPQRGYDESKKLLERWHGKGRQLYGITPRFVPTSTPEQLEMAGALWREFPGSYLQSHVSESVAELQWVAELHPESSGYLDLYDRHGLLGPRSIYAHAVHLSEAELRRCHEAGSAIAHCPSSNFFLGSGCFDLANAKQSARRLRVGLGTDVGAGTSLSLLETLNEAYKAAQLCGASLGPAHAFYLATRGGAEALCLEDRVGSIAPGMEADLVVLDLRSTPLIDYRMRYVEDLLETLFVQLTLGDDRAIRATYLAGALAHERE